MNSNDATGVVWISGYSSSGKTSVGRKLKALLQDDGVQTIFLDGDELRSVFANRWGYEREEREELAKVYFRLCSHLASQGVTVVIAAVAMYDEVREWLKENVPNAIEVYLDVPEEERRERDRDTKGIYKKNQDFSKIYDAPKNADLVVENYGDVMPEKAAEVIKQYFYEDGLNRRSDRGKKKYWENYYLSAAAPVEPSPFAKDVAARIDATSRLIEIGCGNGRDSIFLGSLCASMVAVDASTSAIEFCEEIYNDQSVEFVAGTADNLVAEYQQQFDVLYSRFCIDAMTRPEEAEFLVAASKLLRPSGIMYIECRSINDPLAREGEVISLTERICGHYRRFIVLDELKQSITAKGFEILESIESKGLAKFGDEDPVVIRVVCSKTNVA